MDSSTISKHAFDSIFELREEYYIIVCHACPQRVAVVKQHVSAHVRDFHRQIPVGTRQLIAQHARQLHQVADHVDQVVFPPPGHAPVEGFPIYSDAYQCCYTGEDDTTCRYVCLGKDDRHIKDHWRKVHGWVNPRPRGRHVTKGSNSSYQFMWKTQQYCQRFFDVGGWQRYFVVKVEAEQHPLAPESNIIEQGEKLLAQHQAAAEGRHQEKLVEADNHRYVANSWLKRVGWARHLVPYQEQELPELIRPARRDDDDEKEQQLWWACRITRRVLCAAPAVCQPEVVGMTALEYINRRETGEKNNEKPLYAKQMGKTIYRYSQRWCAILRYIWRTHPQQPTYHLTHHQEACQKEFQSVMAAVAARGRWSAELRSRGEATCLRWWIALFDHDLRDDEYRNAIISGLAVLGWDEKGFWKDAQHYTPILSAMITMVRMLVVLAAHRERQKQVYQLVQDGCRPEEAAEQAVSHFDVVQPQVHRFLTLTEYGGRPSPMNWMLKTRTYGMSIRMTAFEEASISWDKDQISCGKVQFRMADLRSMAHGLMDDLWLRLKRDLLLLEVDAYGNVVEGATPLPTLDMDRIYDHPGDRRDGWSFLQDARNMWSVDGQRWLHDRVLREPKLTRRFIEVSGDRIVWKKREIEKYFASYTRVKEDWKVAHQMFFPPRRGTEGLTIQHCNSAISAHRGLFIEHGMVHTVTGYHKGMGISGRAKIIHQYMPRELGEWMVYMIWLVEASFITQLQMFHHDQQEFGPFIWEPRPDEGDDLAEEKDDDEGEDEEEEEEEEGEDDEENEDDDDGDDTREADDAGTTIAATKEVVALNVDGFWSSSRMRYVFQRATLAGMGVKVSIRQWRDIVPAIMREYSRDRWVHEVMADEHDLGVVRDDIRDLSMAHGTHIAGLVYGRDLMEAPHQTMRQRDGFRRVGVEWHRFLRFASAFHSDALGAGPAEGEAREGQWRRWEALRRMNLDEVLRRWVGPEARFRGPQREVLEAIMRRQSPLVVVMGTGAGKSWMFQLPAAMSARGMTIVVAPLDSLCVDMVRRCRAMGIRSERWQARSPPEGAQIVLVTPEAAGEEAFHRFMERQRVGGVLDRIVVDECHVVLDSQRGWRPTVLDLIHLGKWAVPLVYFTATLGPGEEATFYRLMGIDPQQVTLLRYSTIRPNVVYQVRRYDIEEEDEIIQALVERKKQQYPLPGQIIIYCGTITRTQRLAEVLGCGAYYRQVGDRAHKQRILSSLVEGREHVFTATNALGLGIDRGSIRVVIHVGLPRQMRDYAQESGRAGRDGVRSEAIVMMASRKDRQGRLRPCGGYQGEAGMVLFGRGGECRRVVLDRMMDGRTDRITCEEGEEKCDVCERQRMMMMMMEVEGVPDIRVKRKRGHEEADERSEKRTVHAGPGAGDEVEEDEQPDEPPAIIRVQAGVDDRREDFGGGGSLVHGGAAEAGEDEDEGEGNDDEEEGSDDDEAEVEKEMMKMIEMGVDEGSRTVSQDQVEQQRCRIGYEEIRARKVEEARQSQELGEMLSRWHGRCGYCVMKKLRRREETNGEEGGDEHGLDACEEAGGRQLHGEARRCRGGIRYQAFAACWGCGLPQELCGRWERKRTQGYRPRDGGGCQWADHFHLGLIMAVMGEKGRGSSGCGAVVAQWVQDEEGWEWREAGGGWTGETRTRLGEKIEWGGLECSRLVRLFYRCATVVEMWLEGGRNRMEAGVGMFGG